MNPRNVGQASACHARNVGQASACHAPRGFTLVELLVVLGIIGLLAALLTPAVMQSLAKARNAAIKSEIDLLHMAMMNYQSEYGVLPPCIDSQFATAPVGYKAGGEAAKHLKRIFPRCADPAGQLNGLGSIPLTTSNALVAWLSGFTTNPTSPLIPGGARVKLYDFDNSRIDSSGQYAPSGKRNSPYLYRNSSAYFLQLSPSIINAPFIEFDITTSEDRNRNGILDAGEDINPPNGRIDPVGEDVNGNMVLDPGEDVNGDGRLNYGAPFNSATFQIICAGRDEQLGTDDDLSNFWPGTRREYLESLKD